MYAVAAQGNPAIIGRVAIKAAAKTDSRLAARFAALGSLGASIIHFAVAPAHWQEWLPAGLFFSSIALFQLMWSLLVLVRTTTPVLAAGIVLNVGTVAMWALSRTAGAPFGPHAGEAELVQAADLCALLLQIYVVMGAGWVWYRGRQGEPLPGLASAVVLLGAVGVVALVSTVGVVSGLQHGHHAPAGADSGHHGMTVDHADSHHGHHPDSVPAPPVIESLGTPPASAPGDVTIPPAVPLHDDHDHDHDE